MNPVRSNMNIQKQLNVTEDQYDVSLQEVEPQEELEDPQSESRNDHISLSPEHGKDNTTQNGLQLPSGKLGVITPMKLFIFIFDMVFHSSPIIFIVCAAITANLHNQEVSQYGERLRELLLLLPTIFPIIFAALMGRCYKYTGLFLAERGTTLGRLEQLIGSTSLFSALERNIYLRGCSIMGYLLMILWLLSPLGGQSALRLLGERNQTIISNGTFWYQGADTAQWSSIASAIEDTDKNMYSSIFMASIFSAKQYQNTSMDLWGNVKLPRYNTIEGNSANDWKPVNDVHTPRVTYASLIGIPIHGISNTGRSNLAIKAHQWDVSCDKFEKSAGKGAKRTRSDPSPWYWKISYASENTTCSFRNPCPIIFKTFLDVHGNHAVAKCNLSYNAYETKISCEGRNCTPVAMKRLDEAPSFITFEQHPDGGLSNENMKINHTMLLLPQIDHWDNAPSLDGPLSRASQSKDIVAFWMADPAHFIGADVSEYPDLYRLDADVVSGRLTIIWNTFCQSTYSSDLLAGDLTSEEFEKWKEPAPRAGYLINVTAEITDTLPKDAYTTNWRWFTCLLVSSMILLAASYLALFLKYYTSVPDIVGYASSVTLMNPYVPTPMGGTTMDGLDRAHLLRDLRVQIGDVRSDELIGAVAFAEVETGKVGRLTRKKEYV